MKNPLIFFLLHINFVNISLSSLTQKENLSTITRQTVALSGIFSLFEFMLIPRCQCHQLSAIFNMAHLSLAVRDY